MKRLILLAALVAVFGCGGQTPLEERQHRQRPNRRLCRSGNRSRPRTAAVTHQCLTLNSAHTQFVVQQCSTSNNFQALRLLPTQLLQSQGVPATAMTNDQQIYWAFDSGVCLGYNLRSGNAAVVEPCAGADSVADVAYRNGTIYAVHANLCLDNTAHWIDCGSQNIDWSPSNVSCSFEVSSGASQSQYLENRPGQVTAAESPGSVIDGVAQPANVAQVWCVEPDFGASPGASKIATGGCSRTANNAFMVSLILGGHNPQDYIGVSSPGDDFYLSDRQTFAGVTDNVVALTVFGGPAFWVNPTSIGIAEAWVSESAPNSRSNAVHLQCNSLL